MRVIIDCNYICHMAKHSMGELSFEELHSGVIFGFLRQMLSLINTFKTNDFIFVWDSRESKRKVLFPTYKANRHYEKTEEEKELDAIAYKQFDILRTEVIPKIGFVNNFMMKGYEADDVIAGIVFRNKENFVIVSSDNDLLQLLNNRVRIYSIKNKSYYTEEMMLKEYNISPDKWAEVKAIAGCISDNVIGIKGVGEKTAIKYLNGEINPCSKVYSSIKKFNHFDRNIKLTTLPYEGTPIPKLKQQGETSYMGMYSICEKYGFMSLLNKEAIQKWKTNLKAV